MTDPIADMLTRIRNAAAKRHEIAEVPSSNMKLAILEIMKKEGYIRDFHTSEHKGQGKILVHLKYSQENDSVIRGLRRISSPGRRVYVKSTEIKPVFHGTGLAILSTPLGLLTDSAAREKKVGGEWLLNIW